MDAALKRNHLLIYAIMLFRFRSFTSLKNDIYNRLNFPVNISSTQGCFIITCCCKISEYQKKSVLCHGICNTRNAIICLPVDMESWKILIAHKDRDPNKLFHFRWCNIELISSFFEAPLVCLFCHKTVDLMGKVFIN